MIHQIFNFLYSKIFKLIQNNNKNLLLFIVILLILYNYGYITESRILIFSIVIIWICVYKILCKKIKEKDINCSENLLYILLWVDYFKLSIINSIIFVSIKLYDLKINYESNYIIKMCILVFENVTINPLKMILYKFYNVLYNWKTTPILEIFFKRIYGSVLGILIFSNVIGYVWYLLSYSWLNVYLVLLIINAIDEISKTGKYDEYSIFYYIKIFKLNKDLIQIIEQRSLSSVFSLYIQKIFNKRYLSNCKKKIKRFAFMINNFYYTKIKIINHKNQLKQYKLNNQFFIFKPFYIDIVILLNNYLCLLSQIEYVKIKIKKDIKFKDTFSSYELYKLKELEEFILLIIKMLLYYLWDFENVNKLNADLSNVIIYDLTSLNELKYKWCLDNTLIKKSNSKIFNIQENKEFYEQFYLYSSLLSVYYKTRILNFENYNELESFIDKFLIHLFQYHNNFENYYGIEIDFERANDTDAAIEQEILKRLNEYKSSFIEEWKNTQKLDLEKRNFQRLEDLNEYIVKKIKEEV